MIQPLPNSAIYGEVASWWGAVEVCLPSHKTSGPATFSPGGGDTINREWNEWVSRVFVPRLRSSLPVLQSAVAGQDWECLLEADALLGAALPEPLGQRSLTVGRRALLDFIPPQGAKTLGRLTQAAKENDSVGHLATVFAVRAQVFHLPGVQLNGALLLAEGVLGASSVGVTLSADHVVEMLAYGMEAAAGEPSLHFAVL